MTIRTPTAATLKKYGLSLEEWGALLEAQNGQCPICERAPPSGRLCIDHEHAKGWKKMPATQRKAYVRGLVCWTCNHYALARGMSERRAHNIQDYLSRYQARRAGAPLWRI